MPDPALFSLLLMAAAALYAAVGHGGASAYLALMALTGFAPEEMRPLALVLNLFVSAIAFIQFRRAGAFDLRLFLLFGGSAIPRAFVGGSTTASAVSSTSSSLTNAPTTLDRAAMNRNEWKPI